MTPQERADVIRTSRVIRAARKLTGSSQVKIAQKIGITQAALSKMESGTSMPSTSQWFRLSREFGIEPESSFTTGLIDNCLPATIETSYPESRFKVPKKYMRHQGSKVRVTRAFTTFFERELGNEKLHQYFEHIKMDPDFFAIYDNQLNVQFTLDIVNTMIAGGYLTPEKVSHLARPAGTREMHGRLHHKYEAVESQKRLFRNFLSEIAKYEINCIYSIEDETANSLTISLVPAPFLKYFDYRNPSLGSFICDYKKEYLRQFSTYKGSLPIEIKEHQCHFKGHNRCVYQMKMAQ